MRICFGWYQDATRHSSSIRMPYSTGLPPSNDLKAQSRRRAFDITSNKGFMVVGEATARLFQCDSSGSASVDIRLLADTVPAEQAAALLNENFDTIALGMAYELRPGVDHSAVVGVLKLVKIPIVVLGLSIVDIAVRPEQMHPSVMDLARVLNDQAALFGVRALSTQQWLANVGLFNGVPLGCPSLHLHPSTLLELVAPQKSARELLYATGGYLLRDDYRTRMLAGIFSQVETNYILQDEVFYLDDEDLKDISFSGARMEFDAVALNSIARRRHGIDLPFKRYFMFDEMNAWRQCLAWHDVYIGDRFHGAITALQAGIPAVIICKDVRSLELADFYDLPALTLEQASALGVDGILAEYLSSAPLQRMQGTFSLRAANLQESLTKVGLSLTVSPTLSPIETEQRRVAS